MIVLVEARAVSLMFNPNLKHGLLTFLLAPVLNSIGHNFIELLKHTQNY